MTDQEKPLLHPIGEREYSLDRDVCAEREITALLNFLGSMRKYYTVIEYITPDGTTETMSSTDLRRNTDTDELTHLTYLNGRAYELLIAEDVKVRLIDPDLPGDYDFDFLARDEE